MLWIKLLGTLIIIIQNPKISSKWETKDHLTDDGNNMNIKFFIPPSRDINSQNKIKYLVQDNMLIFIPIHHDAVVLVVGNVVAILSGCDCTDAVEAFGDSRDKLRLNNLSKNVLVASARVAACPRRCLRPSSIPACWSVWTVCPSPSSTPPSGARASADRVSSARRRGGGWGWGWGRRGRRGGRGGGGGRHGGRGGVS